MRKQTIKLENTPQIITTSSVVGKKEIDGPLGNYFEIHSDDEFFGEKSFEKAESKMMQTCINNLISKSNLTFDDIDYIFAGDLLNQCISSGYCIRDTNIPFLGLYGACSTFCESMLIGSLFVNAGYANKVINATSSHFCSAEKQFRMPLEHGNQTSTTAQNTVTGSGCTLISNDYKNNDENYPCITYVTPGKIVDLGVCDISNMGAAMAPAAFNTIATHLTETNRTADYYDVIITGDLGTLGSKLLTSLFEKEGIDISKNHKDCGAMIYDLNDPNTKCGGSGCGCIASVFSSYFYPLLKENKINKVLLVATGALMNTTTCQQGETIPCIAHAIAIENEVK